VASRKRDRYGRPQQGNPNKAPATPYSEVLVPPKTASLLNASAGGERGHWFAGNDKCSRKFVRTK